MPISIPILQRRLAGSILAAIVFATQAYALPSDRQQLLTFEADRQKSDKRQGVTVLQGDVVVVQGSLRITADEVTIYYVDNKASRLIAIGQPAHFQQQPALDQQLVIANGATIEYLVDKESLQLRHNASLEQAGSVMRGDRIDYDMKSDIVVATGDPDTAENRRVHIVIPPQTDEPSDQYTKVP